MRILSIETSCDDTCISMLEVKDSTPNFVFRVLANNSNSQINVHIPYGGVYPVLAKREHQKNLPIVLEKTLKETGISRERSIAQAGEPSIVIRQPADMRAESARNSSFVDLIAVTYGPGLEMCLWEGIIFAQNLAKKWGVPVVPVNHMEGHILSVFGKGTGKFKIPDVSFPVLALLVSGGHTELVLVKAWENYKIIGETLDDAVGEAFDKVARMLGLPYPGGPEISKLAEEARLSRERSLGESGFVLPRPMLKSKDFNFSFAGLKTAVLYLIRKIGPLNKKTKAQIALEFENAAVEVLVYKTAKAVEKYKIKTLIVAGGVAANKHLRKEMSAIGGSALGGKKLKVLFPVPALATDNSIMIGMAGYLNYIKKKGKLGPAGKIKAIGNLRL